MRYKYHIQNLDCANCAREVEEGLAKAKAPQFHKVVVSFSTSRLAFDSDEEIPLATINRLVQAIEPDARVTKITTTPALEKSHYTWLNLIIGTSVGLLAYFLPLPLSVKILGYIVTYGLLIYSTAISASQTLIHHHTLNENALITISCLGALAIGEILEGMMVIILFLIGKILEEKAIRNSRTSIKELVDLKQDFVHLQNQSTNQDIKVEAVKVGDVLLIKKGEKVPVDGKVIQHAALLDTAPLTGESLPTHYAIGETVLSGSINLGENFEIEATSTYQNSTVHKILDLLDTAAERKAKTETLVAKFSKYYTPTILALAILIGLILPTFFHVTITDSVYRALTFLVVACPCAIAISVPLAYFTGIGVASRRGILIKGSNFLDNLSNARNIIFDKTGTITTGDFAVSEIKILDQKYSLNEVTALLIAGERLSNHPIAKSILKLKTPPAAKIPVRNFRETAGQGIEFTTKNHAIKIGNQKVCNCHENAILHLNIDGKHIASVSISDTIKPHTAKVIAKLKQLGLKTYIFTGDKRETATHVATEIGIDQVYAEMLPTDKFETYEKVSQDGITIFVGDGINDAPVLKRANIGISMGGVGSESAVAASDIVIMQDELAKIYDAMTISHFTKHIIWQNLIFAITVKLVILVLSVFGLTNMWWAVFADTGVTLLTILNTLRIIRKFSK